MSSLVYKLTERGLIKPPSFLASNVQYETAMGSMAYGVNTDESDEDIYGFCFPPKEVIFPHLAGVIPGFDTQVQKFDQYQQHHIKFSEKKEYDITIYNIVKYFRLCLDSNPNMIDSLFTPAVCVKHITQVGNIVRENRKLFLSKKCWPKFKGYSYSQMNKIMNKTNPISEKRKKSVEKYGYDCYLDSETRFLTKTGWKRYDEIDDGEEVGTVDPFCGEIKFQKPLGRISKLYVGPLYTIEPPMSKCTVTQNHRMLASPCHRNSNNRFSTEYELSKSDWNLIQLSDIFKNKRSFFHYYRRVSCSDPDYKAVDDFYLMLSGLYLSDGTTNFRELKDGKVAKSIRLSQTKDGKFNFLADQCSDVFGFRKYSYKRASGNIENIWLCHGKTAKDIYSDFGHGSLTKTLPNWVFNLSYRQVILFKDSLMAGDVTEAPNGQVYYSSNSKLVDKLHALFTSKGILCSKRGPYFSESSFGGVAVSYQLYVPHNQDQISYINYGRLLKEGLVKKDKREGYPIKEVLTGEGCRVVCFETPNGTLITENNGNVAIQGNCKFAYHTVRLLNEVEMILTEGDLDLQRNREQLKSIRRGEWSLEEVYNYFKVKEQELEKVYNESSLPYAPREDEVKQLLVDCLEHHYGSLDKVLVVEDKSTRTLRKVKELVDSALLC